VKSVNVRRKDNEDGCDAGKREFLESTGLFDDDEVDEMFSRDFLVSITYRVTGTRNLIDLVTVIYTDSQGALRTDVNVALPWAKTVVLDPGVSLSSVTATSVAGQLNCSITDASGTAIAIQNNNTMIANCTK